MLISVRIPTENMLAIAINWSLAKCSCPSWSANADESTLRRSLASLDACNSSLHWWLGFWTFLVAFGVALEVVFVVWEYLEELHDLRRCLTHPPTRPTTALFVLGLLGAGLVASGVSGEFWKESQIATVETCTRKGNDALFLLLSKEAGDAETSAKTAHDEADAVGIKAEAIKERLDAASVRLGEIEQETRIQGPRWKILELRKDELIKSLKPFAPQKIFIMSCGAWGTVPIEPFRVAQDMFGFLAYNPQAKQFGAGWSVNGGSWDSCSAGGGSSAGGNLVITSLASEKTVGDAAHALYDTLNRIGISTIELKADPNSASPSSLISQMHGPTSPWVVAAKDPAQVVLLIGDNPMFDVSGWKARQKARHK